MIITPARTFINTIITQNVRVFSMFKIKIPKYCKITLLKIMTKRLGWDCHLIGYRHGCEVPPHHDKIDGFKHYRLIVVLKRSRRGGKMTFFGVAHRLAPRVLLFRSDLIDHGLTRIDVGSRWVISMGMCYKSKK